MNIFRLLLIFNLLQFFSIGSSQAQEWSLDLPHPKAHESSRVAVAPDGNIIVADSHEALDTTTVSKISPTGTLIWQKQIKTGGIWEMGPSDSQKKGCTGIHFDPDGSVILLLNRNPAATNGLDIVRLDAGGNQISRVYSTVNSWTNASVRLPDGDFVVSRAPGYGLSRVKTDGMVVWQNNTTPASINFTNSLTRTANGDLWTFCNGFFQSGSGGVVMRANDAGAVQNTWAMPSVGGGFSTFNICAGADGNVLVASSNLQGGFFRRILAADGTVVFSESKNVSVSIHINAALALPDGYVLAGQKAGKLHIWRLDLGGSLIFERDFLMPANQLGQFTSLSLVAGTMDVVGCGWLGVSDVTADVFVQKFNVAIPLEISLVRGKVRLDPQGDCASDVSELGFFQVPVLAVSAAADSFFTFTNQSGDYRFWLDTGVYNLQVVDNHPLLLPCPSVQTATVDGSGDTLNLDFWVEDLYSCPLLDVSLGSPPLRRCFPNTLVLSFCNYGTQTAFDSHVEILLDPNLQLDSSSVPLSGLAGDTLIFELGDLAAGQCGQFNLYVSMIDCDSIALGTVLCSEAWIFPDTICGDFPNWSGASMAVGATCKGNQVKMFVTNRGTAPTSGAIDYIVTEDNVILMQGNSHFNPTDTIWHNYPNNGHFRRIASEQEPGHPGYSLPIAFLKECVDPANMAYLPILSLGDGENFHDILCRKVVGSWDPNAKSAEPEGYGANHAITRRDEIEYLVQFQNTGTDTAFTVVIRDTLSKNLNPASVRIGASSHPMTWEMAGNGVLIFNFENIQLPDSNVNEAKSHGWLTFRIAQKPNLAWGSRIENRAAIYFDFNPPIYTNTVFHTVDTNFILVKSIETFQPEVQVEVFPNPFFEKTVLKINGLEVSDGVLQVFDVQNRLLRTRQFSGSTVELRRDGLAAGFYFFRIFEAGKILAAGKMVLQN